MSKAELPPAVDCERMHALVRVRDVAAAVEFYTTRLGFTKGFLWGPGPDMAGVNLDHVQIFLQRGTPDPQGAEVYFVVADADALFAFQRAAGAEVIEPPGDRAYELRDYSVRDPDGNKLTFGHYVPSRTPEFPVERVDVPVRLEKRLAAVLADVAKAKGMTVGECLEETLLHTFEPSPDGENVPSPHTRTQLALIQRLKARHGLDYDCHASYRFVEQGKRGDVH
ncbi:MAG TPA: VOC family protein [Gemmatimonadaceae bacterium]|nr:VOC family protein [Gemmatimonadaceae bacterium]